VPCRRSTAQKCLISTQGTAAFEFSLGVWLIVKGFNRDAVTALASKSAAVF
jgi:hypothetical protein